MRRLFARNLLFVIGVNVLVKPIWMLGFDRHVQNLVGHEVFGTFQPLFNLCIIFQTLLDLGLVNYNSKTISENPDELPRIFPMTLTTRLALIVLYYLVVFATALLLGFHKPGELILLAGIAGFTSLNMLMMFFRSNVAALQRFRLDGLLSIADRGIMILLCGLLFIIPATAKGFSIYTYVGVQLIGYALAAALALFVLRKLAKVRFAFVLEPRVILRIIRDSFPFALLIFLMAIYIRADSLLIERLLPDGKEQAGIYAAAFRPLDTINMPGVLLAGILLPLFSRMLAQKESIAPIVRLSMNLLFPVSVVVVACGAAFGTPLMHLLYPQAGAYDGRVFAWLMGTVPAYVALYIYSTLLTAGGRLRQLHLISLLGIAINLSVNFALIPRLGALGAAIAACCTMAVVGSCFIGVAHKAYALPHDGRWIAAHAANAALVFAAAWCARLLPIDWKLQLCLVGGVAAVLAFCFRFVSVKALGGLVQR